MTSNPTSRAVCRQIGAAALIAPVLGLAVGAPASALSTDEASQLVSTVVSEIDQATNSGKTGPALYREFERIFDRYADVDIIAQSVLGVEWRSASNAQRRAYTDAFKSYLARKYGRRFQEFKGGRIEVNSARPVRSFFEVKSTAYLRGESPFEVIFLVSDRSGRDLFFNIIIEGVNLSITERTEIGALLDRNGGNLDAMIQALRQTT
jgi:phospholipid transport system substrate-binding protein